MKEITDALHPAAAISPPAENPSPEWNILNNYTKQYLTRSISTGRKFDIVTFFYFSLPPIQSQTQERTIVRKIHTNRSLPPTLDAIIPRYCVVFVDCIGRRHKGYRGKPIWQTLQRAVLTSVIYSTTDHDLSTTITFIQNNNFDAIYLVNSIIPNGQITTIDIVGSSLPSTKENVGSCFKLFVKSFQLIKNALGPTVKIDALCEVDLKKNYTVSHELKIPVPETWKRFDVPVFGYSSTFITTHSGIWDLQQQFQKKYLTEAWTKSNIDITHHNRFTNLMFMCSTSSTLLLPPLTLPKVLCHAAISPQDKIEPPIDVLFGCKYESLEIVYKAVIQQVRLCECFVRVHRASVTLHYQCSNDGGHVRRCGVDVLLQRKICKRKACGQT